MRLYELGAGSKAVIVKILGHGAFRKRLIEMGFVRGKVVEVLLRAPLKGAFKYRVMDYEVSLRPQEANLIEVVSVDDSSLSELNNISHTDTISEANEWHQQFSHSSKTINIALIGNPNCGKTSLFNIASGAHEHVGNYSGVTVDATYGKFNYNDYTFNIVDLPGTYSLDSYSPEELYVRRYLKEETPDVIVNVVVASNLERNLYLTTELIDMDRSMVIALNMYDEAERNGDVLNYELLGQMIGVPIVPTISKTGFGIEKLFDTIIAVYEMRHDDVRHVHVHLGNDIEESVNVLKNLIKSDADMGRHFSPRYLSIKLLEHDKEVEKYISESSNADTILAERDKQVHRIETLKHEDASTAITNHKYGFISGALAETLLKGDRATDQNTRIIDAFVTNKLFGFPLFILIMFVTFWLTFEVGSYPMAWIESGVEYLGEIIQNHMADGILKDLITDGIIGGVGGVIVFLPNILILYLCISFMEDSGYMARAAFIMDKLMHKVGLHGKSFIPLIMGFGCNVPAIMSSRSIESKSSRIITILINPFMSCSARLPIYVLLIGAFFPSHAALTFLTLYLIGILVAVITARLLRKFYFKTDETPFVMELPPYRMPTFKSCMRHMWNKAEQYIKKMGGIILVASIVVWALNYFPHHNNSGNDTTVTLSSDNINDSKIDMSTDSYLQIIGKTVTPVMEPLGFTWRSTVAAIAGVPAKEIVVSTIGVLYTGEENIDTSALKTRISAVNPATGVPDFTAASALAFMIFILLYCPCIATITAIVRETGRWQYGLFSIIYNTTLAWVIAWIVYQIALLF